MSTTVATRPTASRSTSTTLPLDAIVEFASSETLPDVAWLSKLASPSPHRNLHSLHPTTLFLKRTIDVLIAGIGLLVLWPVLLVVGMLIRLTSKGPAIYPQTRVGLNLRDYRDRRQRSAAGRWTGDERRAPSDRRGNFTYGRHFTMYKFRTMRTDAEAGGAQFTQDNDPRITPLGRLLRKMRIDELPQLWNVLKGEMTLVGPRPERPEFIKALSDEIPDYLDRLGLKPGITGVAQIVNGYDNDLESFRRKVAFDLLYLRNCCVYNDLKIMMRTLGTIVTGKGAL